MHECIYIRGRVCSTSKCAIQVNKVGLKPTYSNTCNIENFVTQLIFLGICPKKKKIYV